MKFGTALLALVTACYVTAAPSPSPEAHHDDALRARSHRGKSNSYSSPTTQASCNEAAPTQSPDNDVRKGGSTSSSAIVGAAYFITNDPDGNHIVTANIGPDGNVTFAGTVSADGLGEHGDDGGQFASDATYSNGIIVVHPETQLLATTNTKSNTVVLFRINPEDPSKLTMVGSPVSSEGEFPSSVAFNQAGDLLCVMNAGTMAGVFCYDVTKQGLIPKEGSLRTFPRYNQTTPPQGPINTASQVMFTEDQKNVVVAIKGFLTPEPTRGGLLVWPLGPNNTLADEPVIAGTPAPGGFTFSLTAIPGKNAFFSADFSSGFDIWSFQEGIDNINVTNSRTIAADVPGEITTCWSTWSPTINSFYLSDPSTCLLTEITLDDNLNPKIVANHTFPAGAENIDVAVGTINGQDYLYALLTNELSVGVMRLDGTGDATLTGIANFTEPVAKAGVPIRPNFTQGMALFIKSGSKSS